MMRQHRSARSCHLPGPFLALLLTVVLAASCGKDKAQQLNLLFITLDTTRLDHLQIYGYDRETSPELEVLSKNSVVFNSAFAQETSTAPSHATMFTGQYPFNHGVMANEFRLASESHTLAERLTEAGYRTGGFVGGWTMAARTSGLDRGFQIYDDEIADSRRSGAETVFRALDWLGSDSEEPFFLFVHLFDAHGPYSPPPEFQQMFQSEAPGPQLRAVPTYQEMRDEQGQLVQTVNPYIDRYDSSIRFIDDLIAALIDSVDLTNTVVVVAADHGESLNERYWSVDHGGHVFDEQAKIPLLLHMPGKSGRRIDALVETVDLLPTLLELLGLEPPAEGLVSGRSLVPLINGDRDVWRRFVFTSAKASSDRYADRPYELDSQRKIYGVRSDDWKLINYPGVDGDYWELYDLQSDPMENTDVAAENPEIVQELKIAMATWLKGARRTQFHPVELSDEERQKLLALGYLE